jgi:hypothetical protein
MSVIFIDWRKGMVSQRSGQTIETAKMKAFANKSLALLSATQG